MKKIFLVTAILATVSLGVFYWQSRPVTKIQSIPEAIPPKQPDPTQLDFTARFEIYTNGTKRIFTAAMYHNQSPDVYIENSDPSTVYVKKENITWDDFFKTLPFSVTKDCLVTGTKQTFCSNSSEKLKFILDGVETANALELDINPNDFLEIRYE